MFEQSDLGILYPFTESLDNGDYTGDQTMMICVLHPSQHYLSHIETNEGLCAIKCNTVDNEKKSAL